MVFPDGEYVIDRDVILDCDVRLSGHTSFRVTENGSFTVNGEFYAGKRRIFSGDGPGQNKHEYRLRLHRLVFL